MEFIEDFRRRLKISKYSFSSILGKTPPAYESLIRAYDRITVRDLIALRSVALNKLNMTDTEFLNAIEEENLILEQKRKQRKINITNKQL